MNKNIIRGVEGLYLMHKSIYECVLKRALVFAIKWLNKYYFKIIIIINANI